MNKSDEAKPAFSHFEHQGYRCQLVTTFTSKGIKWAVVEIESRSTPILVYAEDVRAVFK